VLGPRRLRRAAAPCSRSHGSARDLHTVCNRPPHTSGAL
jgi:hypothetical protein